MITPDHIKAAFAAYVDRGDFMAPFMADEGDELLLDGWFDLAKLAKALQQAVEQAPAAEPTMFLIWKNGRGFYRPDAHGYTFNHQDAGRFTLAEAVDRTYPNGPEGPRDGLIYVPAPTEAAP